MTDFVVQWLRPLKFRGKHRLLAWLTPASGTRQASLFGSQITLDLSDFIQRNIYSGTYEVEETQVVRKLLKPGMTFVDVGANVGYYTALAAHLVGDTGLVISCEPSRYAFDRLRTLVDANGLRNTRIYNVALADAPGVLPIYVPETWGNHTPTMVGSENSTVAQVQVETLDRLLAEVPTRIDLLKVDVEGFEPKVLQGASKLLRDGRVRHILCELNEAWLEKAGSSSGKVRHLLAGSGFDTGANVGRSDNALFTYIASPA